MERTIEHIREIAFIEAARLSIDRMRYLNKPEDIDSVIEQARKIENYITNGNGKQEN